MVKDAMSVKKFMSPRRRIRYYWLRLIRLRGNPFVIARGIAVGAFVGVTPTIPFHTVLTVFFCTILRANIIAAVVANWIVSNPVTIPVEYYLSWRIGVLVTGKKVTWGQVQLMLHEIHSASFLEAARMLCCKFAEVLYCLVTGGLLLALPVGLISYFCAVYYYFYLQRKRQERFLKRISKNRWQ